VAGHLGHLLVCSVNDLPAEFRLQPRAALGLFLAFFDFLPGCMPALTSRVEARLPQPRSLDQLQRDSSTLSHLHPKQTAIRCGQSEATLGIGLRSGRALVCLCVTSDEVRKPSKTTRIYRTINYI
jgi:hypothetical protein